MARIFRKRIGLDYFPLTYKYRDLLNRFTRVPVLGRAAGLFDNPRDSTLSYIPVNEGLELPAGMVAPASIVEHFIREASHHFIMSRCPCRTQNGCEDYPRDIGCTFLGAAVSGIDVDPSIGRRVSVEEALEHEERAREAGLVPMVGKFKTDAWLMGVTRDHRRLMTVCHCCPCCCLGGSIRYADERIRRAYVRLKGLRVTVDADRCRGCGTCVEACMFKSMTLRGGKAGNDEECKGCGFCAAACPNGAISIRIDDTGFIEEVLSRINKAVNVG
jgi:Pyruvate/2-oxoacid:ferredoxin oxidoreductase delta subunit